MPTELPIINGKLEYIDQKLTKEEIQQIAQAVTNNQVVDLTLQGCEIDDDAIAILSPAIKVSSSLKCLNMSQNALTDNATGNLTLSLGISPVVKVNLSNCKIGDGIAKNLAILIGTSVALSELNLSNNAITDVGLKEMLDQLNLPYAPILNLLPSAVTVNLRDNAVTLKLLAEFTRAVQIRNQQVAMPLLWRSRFAHNYGRGVAATIVDVERAFRILPHV